MTNFSEGKGTLYDPISGAAAYTGAVTHTLSVAVIICELTGQLTPILPVLVRQMHFTSKFFNFHNNMSCPKPFKSEPSKCRKESSDYPSTIYF